MMTTRWKIVLASLLLLLTAGLWACDCGDTNLHCECDPYECCDEEGNCADGFMCEGGCCVEACDACIVALDCAEFGDCLTCTDGCCVSGECSTDEDCPPENDKPRYCPDLPDPQTGCKVCLFVRCETDEQCDDPTFPLYVVCEGEEYPACVLGDCECVEPCRGTCPDGTYCCKDTMTCDPIPVPCEGVECPECEQVNPEPGGVLNDETCVIDDADCSCVPLPDLDPAFAGEYSAVDLGADGIPVLSGYYGRPYGDLLFGMASGPEAGASVAWEFVDGVPVDAPCEGPAAGPRGGIAEPGDDVGWDSDIVVDGDGLARISYHDRTNGDLKYAAFDGAAWNVHVVDEAGETGRFTSMVLDVAGNPIIAYMTVRDENIQSHLKVAWATTPTPAAAADWTVYVADTMTVHCRAEDCPDGEACLAETGVCAVLDDPANCGGGNGCGDGEVCVAGSCEEFTPESSLEDLPAGVGLFASLDLYSNGTPAVVYHDSINGDLKYVVFNGVDAFGPPVVLDGDGNAGADCSLFISSDDVEHVVYQHQSGEHAELYYWNSDTGLEVVDQGARDANGDPTDPASAVECLHWVGNFARVAVDPFGNARVAYQDGTSEDLVVAVRNPGGVWTVEILARKQSDDNFVGAYGFFVDQVLSEAGDLIHISNFKHNLRTDPWSSEIDLRTHTVP